MFSTSRKTFQKYAWIVVKILYEINVERLINFYVNYITCTFKYLTSVLRLIGVRDWVIAIEVNATLQLMVQIIEYKSQKLLVLIGLVTIFTVLDCSMKLV